MYLNPPAPSPPPCIDHEMKEVIILSTWVYLSSMSHDIWKMTGTGVVCYDFARVSPYDDGLKCSKDGVATKKHRRLTPCRKYNLHQYCSMEKINQAVVEFGISSSSLVNKVGRELP